MSGIEVYMPEKGFPNSGDDKPSFLNWNEVIQNYENHMKAVVPLLQISLRGPDHAMKLSENVDTDFVGAEYLA